MQFRSLSDHPKSGFTTCLVKRNLDTFLKINGVVQYGLKERRSEYLIALFTGFRWIGREEHWAEWLAVPPENSSAWNSAKLLVPDESWPVLAVLPQPVILRSLIIPAGLVFARFDNDDRTWKVHQRFEGLRITDNDELAGRSWIDIGNKTISSWLKLPETLNERLRTTPLE